MNGKNIITPSCNGSYGSYTNTNGSYSGSYSGSYGSYRNTNVSITSPRPKPLFESRTDGDLRILTCAQMLPCVSPVPVYAYRVNDTADVSGNFQHASRT